MRTLLKLLFASLLAVATLLPMAGAVQAAERYKPFVLAWRGTGDFQEKVEEVKQNLEDAGFTIVAVFDPYDENAHVDDARVIVFTSEALKKVAAKSEMGGFAAPQRAAVTRIGDDLQVAYFNPLYMAYAYRLKSDLSNTAAALEKALGKIETFGSRKGLTARKLRKYHYTFGMEYFDDPYELAEYGSHKEALAAVEKHLDNNDLGVKKVYRIDIPGTEQSVFGITRRIPEGGDKHADDQWIMGVVDFEELKVTPYLPYEIMVDGKDVVALHMRFRMAVSRPDLKMMGKNSFMNLMPSPEAIRKLLTRAVGGEP
ncbi:hypothetical protein QVG61_03620 [Thiohalobacter sp. IOR34]|uniref:hypothetical protein n=1 Tax=Thiohalobacter sp. IOR34 TaxID=3057176 RepID=UPI0025AFE36E|nr:hypothetical protein [Thiohalobacter sp. IOR34]WJW76193.1 hypothetical protein QVG61_03620 [Thiohalobacter sp. IOR34]